MATVSPTQFRPTDVVQYIPYNVGVADPSAKGIALTASKTGHIKLFVTAGPTKLLDIQVLCDDGAVVAATSFTAAWGSAGGTLPAASASLGNTISAATLPVASAATSLPITTATAGDTDLPITLQGNVIVGVNYSTPSGSTVALVGFIVRYRTNVSI